MRAFIDFIGEGQKLSVPLGLKLPCSELVQKPPGDCWDLLFFLCNLEFGISRISMFFSSKGSRRKFISHTSAQVTRKSLHKHIPDRLGSISFFQKIDYLSLGQTLDSDISDSIFGDRGFHVRDITIRPIS
jgi:hypothetical protein